MEMTKRAKQITSIDIRIPCQALNHSDLSYPTKNKYYTLLILGSVFFTTF